MARAAIKFLCARLRETSELAEGIALHSIEMRLARFLLSALKRQHGDGAAIHAFIELGITQGELALLIGASRQRSTRRSIRWSRQVRSGVPARGFL